jgi:peptidyl-prolyl cis-trans isomerase A (cyclophilin A)
VWTISHLLSSGRNFAALSTNGVALGVMKSSSITCSAFAAAAFGWCAIAGAQSSNPTPPPAATAPAQQSTGSQATSSPANQAPDSTLPDAPGAPASALPAPVPTGPTVIFDTSMGRMTCKLFDKQSPLATANFIGLAEGTKEWSDPVTGKLVHGKPLYNGLTFHRVIPGFMVQGGDPRGDGTGDAGYYFNNENTPGLTFDVPGRLAMANSGENTNSSQFFITELPQPDLDGRYTIFGQCDPHSVLIVASITRVDRDAQDKPLTPVRMTRVTIVRDGQPTPPAPPANAAPASTPNALSLAPPS